MRANNPLLAADRGHKVPYHVLPDRFAGRPEVYPEKVTEEAKQICPVSAISENGKINLGRCIFCGKCAGVCPEGIRFSGEYRMGAFSKEALEVPGLEPWKESSNPELRKLCGKSFKIRQVSAGGCAACELDFNVLNTLAWDMGRFGIKVAASPRHADAVLVTGPVSDNMRLALQKTCDAMGEPKLVIACGACAVSGGLFQQSDKCSNGAGDMLKVDLFVPGCPPHPATLLEALVRFMGRKQLTK